MKEKIAALATEQRNLNTMDLDILSTREIVDKMNIEDYKVPQAIRLELDSIAKMIDSASEAYNSGGRIIYMGAGTSGRIGISDASECPPTFGVSHDDVVALIAGGTDAIFKAVEGAEDSRELGVSDLKAINLSEKDFVIGLAASGRTPYVIAGLEYANSIGCNTGCVVCVKGSHLGETAKFPVEVEVGPEAITGSTRLKAGTAQKLVLNMVSSAVMIKAGKVYQNLMVDVKTSNEKLINRATRIVSAAVEVDFESAAKLLKESNMDVKLAILMGIANTSLDEAKQLLEKGNNNVAKTIRSIKK